jgi:hypothetical protein
MEEHGAKARAAADDTLANILAELDSEVGQSAQGEKHFRR